jgi:coenzyme F420-0:L-glutamate ligase/coenzyme F420-1:gamma-L-glutamate ligase
MPSTVRPSGLPPVDFWSVLEGRRTIRFYTPDPIPEETIRALLNAAVLAPSGHNAQPWRFVLLTTLRLRQRLTAAMAKRWERDMRAAGLDAKVIQAELRFSGQRFVSAPLLVLPCLTMENMDHYPDRAQRRAEHAMATQSVAAAIQNLLLAADGLGLGACWCCAPLFCQGLVRRILGLPRAWEPQALITIGVPGHTPPRPPRKAVEAVTRVL